MPLYSPAGLLKRRALEAVEKVLLELSLEPKAAREGLELGKPPRGRGEVAVRTFKAIKLAGASVGEISRKLADRIEPPEPFESVEVVGGYVNFKVDVSRYALLVYDAVAELREMYGFNPAPVKERVIVEHTSANPIHPLHIGHLRNALLGDALARILRARGHEVKTHFYVDDTGLQVAYAAYGYSKVKRIKREMKPDHFIGLVYSMTNAIVEIRALKRRIEEAAAKGESVSELHSKLADWMWTANQLREKDPELFDKLAEEIKRDEDPLARVYELNRAYERGDLSAVKLVREVVSQCLKGFEETLSRLDIRFDSWDWESELTVWSGATDGVIRRLMEAGLVYRRDGALVFAADKLAESPSVREDLGIPPKYEVQPLVLTRSDGTTLYTTRDIAYTLWKFRRADRVINVIGVQQSLAQTQIRLALYAMGARREAVNLVHYAYEVVKLKEGRMSSRRGRYVAADDLIDEAIERARAELEKRGRGDPDIAVKVGIGAIKYFFLNVSPSKVLLFDWGRVLDFNQNSGPFVQYAYVRARSILRKAESEGRRPKRPVKLGEEERELVILVGELPEVVAKAADELRPDYVASYLNSLSIAFNSYYDSVPVLRAEDPEVAASRLALVEMVATALRNGMRLLGIEPPERM